MNLIKYTDAQTMAHKVAEQIASELRSALNTKKRVTFSVPGGRTPGPVFDLLSQKNLDWARVDVVLNDERWVPQSSDRSNTRLLKQRLLVNLAKSANLLPLYADAPTPEEKLPELAIAIKGALPIDVLLLGMGDDMHTASLFPDADKIAESFADDAPILLPMRARVANEARITLTAPVLKGAMSTHILIKGQGKLAVILRAAEVNNPLQAPISAFLTGATVHWAKK